MSSAHELDLGPLTWVKGEIDLALERATSALGEALGAADRSGRIKFAQTHLHQAHGALSIVGLDGLTQFSEQLDRLLGEMAAQQLPAAPETIQLATRCIAAIGNYLDELTRGLPDQALRLFGLYAELAKARGHEAPTPGELFFPDLSQRPVFATPAESGDDPKRLRVLRGRFERGLLKWFRNADDPGGPQEMRESVAGIESLQGVPASRAFWYAATAFFDALSQRAIPVDATTKRMCGRIDAQMRRVMEGSSIVAERLMRDVLYHVATASAGTPIINAVRTAYRLDELIPTADRPISDTPLGPLLRSLRDQLTDAREAWDQFARGGAIGLPRFQDSIVAVIEQAAALGQPEVARLASALGDTARWLRQDPLRLTDALSMDIATAMLLLDSRLDAHTRADIQDDTQVSVLLERLQAHQRGERLAPLTLSGPDAQTRQVNRQLAHEILGSLAEVEQSLDGFFRAPSQTDILASVRAPLKQVEGALSMMNEDGAVRLVQDAAARIGALSARGAEPGTQAFEEIAHRLSALGVYIEALQHGPADLGRILNPEAAVEATESVEAELAQQKRETAALTAALKDNPDDLGLRTELQLNLETLRQDASLTADTELEQQARQALTMLDAGELFSATAPIAAVPETPALSAQASRLLDASEEEIDAELLAIFIEEAMDVRATIASNLAELAQHPGDVDVLTTIRRSFHTLKGSGRMVGLKEFGAAAWSLEQTLNHWLRLELPVSAALQQLIGDAQTAFSAWIDQLAAGAGTHRDVSALLAFAERLRSEGEALPATSAAVPPATEEFDLESTLVMPEVDLTETELGISLEPSFGEEAPAEPLELNFPDLSFTELEEPPLLEAPSPPPQPEAAQPAEAAVTEALELPPVPTGTEAALSFDFELPREEGAIEAAAIAEEQPLEPGPALPKIAPPAPPVVETPESLAFIELPVEAANLPELPAGMLTVEEALAELEEEIEPPEATEFASAVFEEPATLRAVEELEELSIEGLSETLDEWPLDTLPEAPEAEPAAPVLPAAAAPDERRPTVEEHLDISTLSEELEEILVEEIASSGGQAEQDEVRLGEVTLSRPLFDLYLVEARQHVATLRHELARLSVNPSLVPPVSAVRAAHTLSGISGTAHFAAPQQLSKALELALQRLADHDRAPVADQVAVLNAAATALEGMLVQVSARRLPDATPELADELDGILTSHLAEVISLRPLAPAGAAAAPAPARPVEAPAAAPALRDEIDADLLPIFLDEGNELLDQLGFALRTWRDTPTDPAHAPGVARLLHTLKGSARMVGAMTLGQSLHDLESRLERARSEDPTGTAILDELETTLDQARHTLETLESPETGRIAPAPPEAAPPGEAAVQPGEVAAQASRTQLRIESTRIDQFVNEAGEISIARTRIEGELRTLRRSLLDLTENVIRLRNQLREVEIQADTQMQSRLSQVETQHTEFDPLEMDRYTRLQELTRMMAESVGDVTTVQQNLLKNLDGAEVALHAQSRMARELQQSLMYVRMVPFDSLAERLYRLVRQTAKELGRRANLDIVGGQIEIDRSVLEAMTGPLGHLVRNAVAHGIEPPEVRRAAGKPEIGQITVRVTHQGNEVVIEFRDDGAGLDFSRIRAQAHAAGLLGPDEDADDKRLTNLIFVPGFTTASLSSLAGRGVGMDVVKSETAAVGGRISVSTEPGQGTTFRIHLPLTLAVTQALLVRAGGRSFAIPSSMVAQVLELKPPALEAIRSNRGTDWLGERFHYRYLPRLLGDRQSAPQVERFNWVLLLRAGSETLALHVDALRGNQEIVVKNAGPQYARMVGFSGATVLGDGEIVLILNPVALAGRTPAGRDEDITEQTEAAAAPSQPTVMVVDDSLTVRKITGRLLEREGYRVVTAKDGVDALEQLLTATPDVIIADIEMPRMDGFDLTRNIRADARLKAVPIIMITSRTAEKHKRYAEEIGVNHYLGKPYDEDVLLGLIRDYVTPDTP